jgi:ribosomal protein S27AE
VFRRALASVLAAATLLVVGTTDAHADVPALPWTSLGTGVVNATPFSTPDQVARNADGRPEYFGVKKGSLLHSWLQGDGTWSGWYDQGGGTISVFSVTNEADGRLRVFAVFGDQTLHSVAQYCPNCGWGPWSGNLTAGLSVSTDIAAGRDGTGKVQVFVVGSDNRTVYRIGESAPNGTYLAPVRQWTLPIDSGWHQLPSTVANNADGRIELFLPLSDGHTWHAWQWLDGTWSGWTSLGGAAGAPVRVINEADGTLAAYSARYTEWHDNALHRIAQYCPNCGWGGWTTVGPNPIADGRHLLNDLTIGRRPDGRLDIYAITIGPGSTDQALLLPYGLIHVSQYSPQGAWSGSYDDGPMPNGWYEPADVNTALGPDGHLWVFAKATLTTDPQDWAYSHVFAARLP